MAPRFASLGFTTCRVKAEDSGGATTTEAVSAGEHLLEIPVRCCWTAASADRECPQVAQALSKAAARHPDCELLRAASTKISLHLLWERRRSPERTDATSQVEHRRAQLDLLGQPKTKKVETLLAWGRRDLESLTGSFWFEEAHRRQEEIVADLQSLLSDLGPKVAAELGLLDGPQDSTAILSGDIPRESVEAYAWSKWLMQAFGFRFLLPSGELLELLAPGLELLEPHEATEHPPGAILRLDTKTKGEAMLRLTAERDFKAGEGVRLWHQGLACSQGFRLLMGLGRQMKVPTKRGGDEGSTASAELITSPWESVEVLLRLPVSAKDSSENSQLWDSIEVLESALQACRPWDLEPLLPGDAVPPDYGLRRVEVIEPDPETTHPDKDGEDHLEVQVRLPLGNRLPSDIFLEQLGLLICADAERMQKVMQEEKDVLNPLGSKACRSRALNYLARRLQWALEEYPSAAEADARALHGKPKAEVGMLPRRVRGLVLVASERQLVMQVSELVKKALESLPSQEEDSTEVRATPPQPHQEAQPDQGESKSLEVKGSAADELNPEDHTIYSLDWDEGEADTTGQEVAIRSPRFQSGVQAFRTKPAAEDAAKGRPRNLKGKKPSQRGATWEDLALEQLVGFALPVLADVTWQPGPLVKEGGSGLPTKPGYVQDSEKKGEIFTPVPDLYERSSSPVKRIMAQKEGSTALAIPATAENAMQTVQPSPGSSPSSLRWALLELPGGSAPTPQAMEALLAVKCEDLLVFSRDKFLVHKKYLPRLAAGAAVSGDGSPTKLEGYDVLVIPLAGWLKTKAEQVCIDLLAAIQATIHHLPNNGSMRILLLTSLAMGPGSSTYRRTTVPAQASVQGLVRTARTELPQVPILWLDTDASGSNEIQEQLMYEIGWAFPAGGRQKLNDIERAQVLLAHNRDVAYRQGRRWVPRLDLSLKMPIYAGRVVSPLPQFVIQTGVALITGGVGGVGLAAAEAMVELGLRNLVLTSRAGQVPAQQGAEERIEALRSAGARVVVEACDVAEEPSVRELLERISDAHGPLRVVIHASGLIEDRSIYDQDADAFRKVFEPKAVGAWHLHRHTLGERLHAFVLCSSVAASFGSRGQANYASASAYLDELARLRTAHDLPAVSLQWPAIDTWPEEPQTNSREGYWNGLPSGLDKKTAKSSVSLSVVRQVFKLAVAGAKDPGEPVQAVLPGAYLSPSSPTVRSLLEPLLARRKGGSAWDAEPGALRNSATFSASGVKLCLSLG